MKPKLIDSHCHINSEYYGDVKGVVQRAIDDNISMIISCSDKLSEQEGKLLLKTYPGDIYLTIGVHPSNKEASEQDLIEIEKWARSDKSVVAIGEIGLDYHWEPYDREKQIELFEKQLRLAEDLDLPVVIHVRDAHEDMIKILKKYSVKGLIHCFGDGLDLAKEYIELGFFLGIGGLVSFKNAKLSEVVKEISLDNIILETDSPYLSPEPFRGKTNEPANVRLVANKLAEIKGISVGEVAKITRRNTIQLFDLSD